ncbi:MAG: tRNA dihydrouridine synthase DusB [Candidatus Omnitrophota bacterium]
MRTDPIKQIIKSRVILAPMSGITDIPFRLMARKFGCKFTFTEMIDVNGILYNNRKTFCMMDTVPEDAPIGIQLVGRDADDFLSVGRICEKKGYKLLDINAGCPAKKVVKCGKGSALMKDVKKLSEIVEKLTSNLTIPVTVKIRSGWDGEHINCVKAAKAIAAAGAAAISIHPRTRDQMYKGKADHELTRKIKEAVNVPVIASGDVFSAEDAENIFEQTGCDAIFAARGSLGRPWIFDEINKHFRGEKDFHDPTFTELKKIITEHYALSLKFYNDHTTKKKMYKHLMWYFKKYKKKTDIMKAYQKVEGVKEFKKFLDSLKLEGRNLYL